MAQIRDRVFRKERFVIDLGHKGLLTKGKVIRMRTLVEFKLINLLHILMLIFRLKRPTVLRSFLSITERELQNIMENIPYCYVLYRTYFVYKQYL